MTTNAKDMLVLKSQGGDYYLLPQELLEHGRVPAEHAAEVERALAEVTDDVAGHLNFTKIVFNYQFVGSLIGSSSPVSMMYRNMAYNADVSTSVRDANT